MIRASAVVPCTSNADDLAFESLADAVAATDGLAGARVVGGHTVGLLLSAFPVPGLVVRRTVDADSGISTEIAAGEVVVARLRAIGGWKLDREPPSGRRLDAARALRAITRRDPRFATAGVSPERFIALVRERVAPV